MENRKREATGLTKTINPLKAKALRAMENRKHGATGITKTKESAESESPASDEKSRARSDRYYKNKRIR